MALTKPACLCRRAMKEVEEVKWSEALHAGRPADTLLPALALSCSAKVSQPLMSKSTVERCLGEKHSSHTEWSFDMQELLSSCDGIFVLVISSFFLLSYFSFLHFGCFYAKLALFLDLVLFRLGII